MTFDPTEKVSSLCVDEQVGTPTAVTEKCASLNSCFTTCATLKKAVFALREGGNCYCANSLGTQTGDDKCNEKCKEDDATRCGGSEGSTQYSSVFKIHYP